MAAAGPSRDSLVLHTDRAAVPLGYVQEPGLVFVIARERGAQWPVDALRGGQVRLELPDGDVLGEVDLISDPVEKARILGLFRERYGPERFARWYERPARILQVRATSVSWGDPTDRRRYYSWLESEFDNVADEYDHHILDNRVNRLLRDRSLAYLRSVFSRCPRLLEIGCGSGMETIPLLREGHEVVAVDISQRMLEVTRAKARDQGFEGRFSPRHMPARDLSRILTEFGEGAFDGAYSTYGALNCEPDLGFLASNLERLLKPRGSFIAGVYNRWCLFELLGYSATFQWRRALARRHRPVPVGNSRFCVDVYAYSVEDFRRLLGGGFRCVRVEGVPVILPPSDLQIYAERFARHFGRLASWDAMIGTKWPWRLLGDHFLMTFVRRAS